MNYAMFEDIIRNWAGQIKANASAVVFGFDFFSPPLPVGRNFARIVERCGDNKARTVASAAVQPIENVLRKGQQVLNWIQFDDADAAGVHGLNQTAKETVKAGFQSAGRSFAGALTGIVTDPIRESKKAKYKSKAVGVLAGIGKGLAGVVVKPVQGILEAGTGIVTGIRKAAEGDEEVLTKQRAARGFPMRQIREYDPTTAALQQICEDVREGELLENFYRSRDRSKFLALTKGNVYVIDGRGKLNHKIALTAITNSSLEGAVVKMAMGSDKRVNFDCESGELALDFMRRMRSNFYMLRIGYESE
jgi:hypothetical protein